MFEPVKRGPGRPKKQPWITPSFEVLPGESPPDGNYYSLRKTGNGLWTVNVVKYLDGKLELYTSTLTSPDLQALTFIRLIRIFEKEYTK